MYKLLALDLDGTVLNSEHGINPAVKQAIMRAKDSYSVVLVTGRHHTAAAPYHRELELATPIICCNGTYVYDYSEQVVMDENAIPKTKAKQFLDLATERGLKLVMYVTDTMTHGADQPIDYMCNLERWAASYPASLRPNISRVPSLAATLEASEYVWKFVIEGEPQQVAAFAELDFIREHFSGEQSWSNRIDFAHRGNAKGHRLAQFVNGLGLRPEQVVAVGDNHNDISMIEFAGLGVAMANAEPAVKQSATITTATDNDGSGLSDLINQYFK